ncbi:hypothetical protein NDU88_005200 [Pleurodeles waltl]|uniref:Uncharacterized protein n=1 Tax=Pleurodeles waltl TaxID=8319 RepID=A0AAV7SL53_PLEWA|nr:hypothetical protein NDU88_005200 [Pleurodeles waltl]
MGGRITGTDWSFKDEAGRDQEKKIERDNDTGGEGEKDSNTGTEGRDTDTRERKRDTDTGEEKGRALGHKWTTEGNPQSGDMEEQEKKPLYGGEAEEAPELWFDTEWWMSPRTQSVIWDCGGTCTK